MLSRRRLSRMRRGGQRRIDLRASVTIALALVAWLMVRTVPSGASGDVDANRLAVAGASSLFSWTSEIQLPSGFGSENAAFGDCCFDFSGDGDSDDGLGSLLSLLATFVPEADVTVGINQSIVEDRYTLLIEFLQLPEADGDVAFQLQFGTHTEDTSGFSPQDFENLYQARLQGSVDFDVAPGGPVAQFLGVRTGNRIEAGPSALPLRVELPLFGRIDATLLEAMIEADLDPNSVQPPQTLDLATPNACVTEPCEFFDHVDGARIGGVLAMDELVGGLDATAVGQREKNGDIIDPTGACACAWGNEADGSDSIIPSDFSVVATSQLGRLLPTCNGALPNDGSSAEPPAGFTCDETDPAVCDNLRLVCTSGSALGLAGVPDIDLPGGEKGVLDGISVGLYASLTGATIVPEPSLFAIQGVALAVVMLLRRSR